jgi:cytochrome c6
MKKLLAAVAVLALVPCLAKAEAPEQWTKLCASCHGADGVGKTKAGKKLEIKDLTDAAYQKSFTDEQALDSLKNGLKSKEGETKMKPFAEKMTPDEMVAVIKYVRTLAK